MKKKIAFDMFLNIVATAIPTIALQLFIQPSMARGMDDNLYGLLVTMLALLNVIPATFGNTLNNIRLIYQKGDDEQRPNYQVLLLILSAVNLLLMTVITLLYDRAVTPLSLLLILVLSLLWLAREYYSVAFRIQLNYVNIVISNLIMVLGYGIGFLLFTRLGNWQWVFLMGNLFSLVFIFLKCSLWKEKLVTDSSFKSISWQMILLMIAGLLTRITTYADKLLIYPVLGGAVVSVYYAATLFGKIVSMAITPISGVMLSYLSKTRGKDDHTFRMTFLLSSAVCVAGYFVCIAISRPVLTLLYPQFVNSAMNYIWITTGTMVLTTLVSVINPFVLRYFDMKWQIIINAVYVAAYVSLSMLLLQKFGLYGFCVGTLIATIFKLILMLVIFEKCEEKKTEP